MTAIMVLIVVGIINIILLFMILSIYKDVSNFNILLTQVHAATGALSQKIQSQEIFLNRLGSAFSDLTNSLESMSDKIQFVLEAGPRMGSMYRTIDGKYTATTLEDLINKIKEDNVEEKYLSQDELDSIRDLFEKEEHSSDDEHDIDGEDDDTFNPNEGKF
jgi:hypothetical protein